MMVEASFDFRIIRMSEIGFNRTKAIDYCRKYIFPFGWWLFGLAICAALACFISNSNWSAFVRVFGMWLQLAGVCLVIHGIGESRRFFNRPGFWKSLHLVFKELVDIFRATKIVSGSVNVNLPGVSAKGMVGTIRTKPTTEERLDELERAMVEIRATIETRLNQLSENFDKVINAERTARVHDHQRISGQLETVAIGSVRIQLGGAFYILLGVAFSSMPDEIVKAIGLA